jgi:hypothetical protein
LGDCYYCVSGVPLPDPKHALNSVKMGLDMINLIKDVRFAFYLPLPFLINNTIIWLGISMAFR